MPRVSDEEKGRTHERILEVASNMLRDRGLEATGVNDVMSAAGLTHGGFYKHFRSKEDMLAAGLRRAATTVLGQPEAVADFEARERAAAAFIEAYLSDVHLKDRAKGCPLAAVAGEALRKEGPVRDAAECAFNSTARLLSQAPGQADDVNQPDDTGLATTAVLVGTIVLARLLGDDVQARRVLELGRRTVKMLRSPPDREG